VSNEARVTLRLPSDLLKRAVRIRAAIEKSNPGLTVALGAVLRMSLERGLAALEREQAGSRK
jgi:hypothetical protein